jgi:hypothetical protein
VWLNYGRFTVFSRLLRRTLGHGITQASVARKPGVTADGVFLERLSTLWSLSTYAKNQSKFAALREHGEFAHLQWIEFSEPSEASTFLKAIATSQEL